MDQLTENIAGAAQTLQEIIQAARQRHDELGKGLASVAQMEALQGMQQKAWVEAHWLIAWPPGVWGKLIALWHKVIRRLLAWYINPIVRQQNEFNLAALQAMQVLSKELLELRSSSLQEHARQHARLDEMAAQIKALQCERGEKEP